MKTVKKQRIEVVAAQKGRSNLFLKKIELVAIAVSAAVMRTAWPYS